MKAYLAYGANTNFSSMNARCPGAVYVCNVTLHHFQLVFRGVADMVQKRGAKVQCALWLITADNEAALDRFEGFPRLYVKRYVTMNLNGRRHRVMFYVMRASRGECVPSAAYEECLREGYAMCGLPMAQLDNAIRRADEAEHQVADRSSWAKGSKLEETPEDEAAALDLMNWYMSNSEGAG